MNKAHLLLRKPHKSKKLEEYLDFLCAFQLKQTTWNLHYTTGAAGPLIHGFPMDGRASANADAVVQGKVGWEQFDGFLGCSFLGGMSLLQDPLNIHFCDIWIHLEKRDSQPKEGSNRKQLPKRNIWAFSLKNAWFFLGLKPGGSSFFFNQMIHGFFEAFL